MSLVRIYIILGFVVFATMTSFTGASAAFIAPTYDNEGCLDNNVAFDNGLGCWVYHDNGENEDKPVRVWYYYPPNYSSGSRKVVFGMHGSSRDALEVLERWQPYADSYGALVIAPEFSRERYPKGRHFNRGNIRDNNGRIRDENDWTFMTIEEIFDLVRREISDAPSVYSIQGHSAGAQFVHRMVLTLPDARIETAVPAGAGWYLHPDEYDDYPCGISDVGIHDDDLKKSYAKDLVITLGTDDDDPDSSGLNHDDRAEAQGSHRYKRGHFFYSNVQEDAQFRGHAFNWTVVDVLGAGHDADSMVESGADAIFGADALFSGIPLPQGIVLSPTQDAVVKASYPNSNYGYRDKLQVDGKSLKTTYMQFDLQAIQTVGNAVLRLKIADPSDGIQYVREVTSNNWDENTLTYNNRPVATTKITSINGGGSESWVSIDITDYVVAKKGKVMSIALDSLDSDGLYFRSKESSDDPPELVIYD